MGKTEQVSIHPNANSENTDPMSENYQPHDDDGLSGYSQFRRKKLSDWRTKQQAMKSRSNATRKTTRSNSDNRHSERPSNSILKEIAANRRTRGTKTSHQRSSSSLNAPGYGSSGAAFATPPSCKVKNSFKDASQTLWHPPFPKQQQSCTF